MQLKPNIGLLAGALTIAMPLGRAQMPPAYSPSDLIVSFEDVAGTDVEFNLGAATDLPASGTVDFGNISALLNANGQTVATTFWSVAAGLTGDIKGGSATTIGTSSGQVTALPNAIWLTQDNSGTPSFVGSASAVSTPVNQAIETVGTDISTQPGTIGPSGIGLLGVAVNAAGDPSSYTSQGSYGNLSENLEITGSGTAALWLLTATTPGTAGKSGANEGPFNGAFDLGVFSLSSSGELTFTSATVGQTPPESASPRIINISSRAGVGTGADVEIAGFVVSGAPGSTEQVLLRGAGPALAQFGVAGVLAQPVLTLFDSTGTQIAANTAWGTASDASDIAAAAVGTGAFDFSAGSDDSAILAILAPGSYTAQIAGLNGTSGAALAEIYEVSTRNAQLINISTRAYVGTGSSVEIGGFVVRGSQPVNVLVRAVGPALSQFGVTGVLAQPSLTVVDSSQNTLATNSGWGNNADPAMIATVAASVGAFALPQGSADCALYLSLSPGDYTAIVSGTGGTSGVALVEIYRVP